MLLSKRRLLSAALALPLVAATLPARAHAPAQHESGRPRQKPRPVQPPLQAPAVRLQTVDGARLPLPQLLTGRVTAVQLMFTGCGTTCPAQGALFARLQSALARQPNADARLLSLSIDALGDDRNSLSAWLQKFGAARDWTAAVPALPDSDRMTRLFQRVGGDDDAHLNRVYLFDREARLVWVTGESPTADQVAGLMAALLQD